MESHTIIRALEYVSQKLCKRGVHIHLIAAGDALSCLLFKSRPTTRSLNILQPSFLPPRSLSLFFSAVDRARVKFGLAANWITTDGALDGQVSQEVLAHITHVSLVQDEVVFSSEGLTVVAVDLIYALKAKLYAAERCGYASDDIHDAVAVLRRLVVTWRGRPVSRGILSVRYPHLNVTDATLLWANAGYEWRYGARGVVGVRDEYMEWRREGRVCGEELSSAEASPVMKQCEWDDKPLPVTPYKEHFEKIFGTKISYKISLTMRYKPHSPAL